ncbi:MAG TPA: hypothetical protein VHF05_02420 [Candidatus Paceibacterota bacterium]|jgi:hypothetical protein|nr:hypothetical protein [Candidatus Paceibacterota bacterium]
MATSQVNIVISEHNFQPSQLPRCSRCDELRCIHNTTDPETLERIDVAIESQCKNFHGEGETDHVRFEDKHSFLYLNLAAEPFSSDEVFTPPDSVEPSSLLM